MASYSQDAVNWAYGKGIINSSFRPDATCTRATTMEYIWKAFGSTSTGFSDVSSGASYAKAVSWAVTNGIVAGTGNGKFTPSQDCTRGTIVTLLHRAYVPSVRLDTGSGSGSGGNKNSTSYGTVDWSTAAQGYITFSAAGAERVSLLESSDGTKALFTVAKGETVKVLLRFGLLTNVFDVTRSLLTHIYEHNSDFRSLVACLSASASIC